MVLFKRKPFHHIPTPANLADNAEVYVMRGTNEVFSDYETYLKRYDYLMQKKFVDSVNGTSNLTFFDAQASENKSSTAIEHAFPDVLRDPILRYVQFSTTSRIDELVREVYEIFTNDFFPKEDVIVHFDENEHMTGVIREKAKFPMIRGPGGEVQRAAFSRYFVRLNNGNEEECLLDDKHIRRNRKVFTKQILRSFLRHSLQREAWNGAPWLVKEHLAIQYRIPMEIPAHLLQDAKLLANKQQMLQAKLPPKNRRPKNLTPEEFKMLQAHELAQIQELQQQVSQLEPQRRYKRLIQNQHPGATLQQLRQIQNQQQPAATRVEKGPPPPPVIKYPIEDLELVPKHNGVKRPELAFFTDEMEAYMKSEGKTAFHDIEMDLMGPLLEIWNTLNVQCEVYILDSFTFDDFVDAMRYKSVNVPCELLEEVHCAVLKLFVDDNGKSTLPKNALPEKIVGVESDAEGQNDESGVSTPLADVPARSTRSRLSYVDTVSEHTRSPIGSTDKVHRVPEMLGDRDWMTRLAEKDFEGGGWQTILAGLLHQLSLAPKNKACCDKVLAELAPIDAAPTRGTAREQFANMNVNLRIRALQMITMLSVTTQPIKDFLEACSEDMTDVRKRKIEHQKTKKLAMEELQVKDREWKILRPENMPVSPKQESVEPVSLNGDATEESVELNGAGSSDPEDEPQTSGRHLRRGNDRKRKREEEAARKAEEKARKTEAAKKENKQSREFKKISNEIEELKKRVMETESKILECDADLREANVQRTKVLGKDRFCNRYYWFERNGQPFGGLPRSSTASYGYANGRIWVQGPDDMEREGFIDRTKAEQDDYKRRFTLTVPERRKLEEGQTILRDAHQWGYYDDPVSLDHLIGWLDDHGEREKKLRKELCDWRDLIVQYMEAHKKFKDEEAAKKFGADEEHVTRITTRHKTHEDQSAARERCLKWTNGMALDEIGHLHSRAAEKPRTRTKVAIRQPKGLAVPVNRQGKPLTRQGDRYSLK